MGTVNLKTASGGSVILSPANTASDVTITVPAANATMAVNGPAFSAYLTANQTPITTGTFTKVTCNSEEFDTNSNYDSTTNYRFTPTVAGYYQVNAALTVTASTSNTEALCVVYKNGVAAKWGVYLTRTAVALDGSSVVSALIYLNGSTDYIELYGYVVGTGTLQFTGSQARTYFQAVMVRSA